jgi:hypothetical protein
VEAVGVDLMTQFTLTDPHNPVEMAALESLWCVMQIVLLKQLQPQVLPLTRFQVAIGFINLQVLVLLLGDAMDLMEFKNGKFN